MGVGEGVLYGGRQLVTMRWDGRLPQGRTGLAKASEQRSDDRGTKSSSSRSEKGSEKGRRQQAQQPQQARGQLDGTGSTATTAHDEMAGQETRNQ